MVSNSPGEQMHEDQDEKEKKLIFYKNNVSPKHHDYLTLVPYLGMT